MSKKTDIAVKSSTSEENGARNDSSAYNFTYKAVNMAVQSAQRLKSQFATANQFVALNKMVTGEK